MTPTLRLELTVPCLVAAGVLAAASPAAPQEASGYPIRNERVVERCSRCHTVDDEGRMSRISWLRKTPEGWQTSVRRMVALHGVRLSPEDARAIVRYLANEHGLAPEELRRGRFEVERRLIDYDYEGDSEVELTCISCHSMGRVITQRRTKEEWSLLLATHRALYPLVDFQAFRRSGPPDEPEEGEEPPDPRHPMDKAIDHLASVFPLETAEWSAWSATKRPPRLEGTWALTGNEPGRGPVYGTVDITAEPSDPGRFTTSTTLVYAETGERATRTGEAIVYTAYQWRGRSNPGTDTELREVLFVERDLREMSGRWFRGAYDELGTDVTLRRAAAAPVVAGVYPRAVRRGSDIEVRVYGVHLPTGGGATGDGGSGVTLDFGPGVVLASVVPAGDGSLLTSLSVDPDAPLGARDLYAFGATLAEALVVHDGVDRVTVTPETGMARVGGTNFPKGYQVFEAIGWSDGPDGEPETDDDLELGRVPVSWSLEEYAATFGDDDLGFVGSIRADGTFVPALDGPNPDRHGNRNNVGDVWVVATHARPDGEELRARAHLLVTVPLYVRFDPWQEVAR